jgi:mitogen-activated protein kinase kinase kinase
MAPEVIKNIEIIDKSDVWSVGCIVVELLTGQIPWTNLADNFVKAFSIISNGVTPPLPKNLSR